MWHTTRYEGFDEPKHSQRAPSGISIVQGKLSAALRTGFSLQVIGLTGLLLVYYAYKGQNMFSYDLAMTTEEQRENPGFRVWLEVFSALQLFGAVYLLIFQAALADDASWARGYRAGAKLFGNAAFFDVVSAVLQFIIYAYMNSHYDKIWWKQFSSGGVEWLICALARLLHGFALLYYASSVFLLEVYHDNGTNDWHGILNCFLFGVAGISEIVVLAFGNGGVAIVINWVALISALVWALAFEQEVNATAPLLNEPELTNEIEARVEKYARATPYLPQCA